MAKDKTKIITGIDVGTSKVCTIVAEADQGGGVKVLGVGLSANEGMKKGLVIDLDAVTQSIYQSLGEAEKAAGWVVDQAFVSVSGSHVTANSKRGAANIADHMRGVTQDDIRRAVEDARNLLLPPDKQIIDVVDLEYGVDNQIGVRDPLGMSGGHLEVLVQIITGSTAFVQNLTKCVLKVGVQIEGVVFSPMAAGEAVLNRDERQIGIILIDMGAGTTDVAVYQGGHLRNAWAIPVGGFHIDNDIAVRFGISHAEAERVKVKYGRAYLDGRDEGDPVEMHHVGGQDKTQVPKGMICQIIQPRIGELLGMVRSDLEENLSSTILPAGIVLTGGAAQLDGLEYAVEQVLGFNSRLGLPIYEGPNAEAVAGPGFVTAMGLVKFAVRHSSRRSFASGGRATSFRSISQMVISFLKGLFPK